MHKHLIFALFLASPVAAFAQVEPNTTPSPEQTNPIDEALIERGIVLLSAYHAIPTRDQLVEELGEQAPEILWAIVEGDQAGPLQRDRALVALAGWPSDRLRAHLDSLLADTSEAGFMDRQRAITAYATAFGDGAIDRLVELFVDPDRDVQLTALQALRIVHTPAARAAIEQLAIPQQGPTVVAPVINADDFAAVLQNWDAPSGN